MDKLLEFSKALFQRRIGKQPYHYQETLLAFKGQKLIINKSRQIGISFIAALKGLLLALEGKTVLIVSPSNRQSKHLMDYLQGFLNTLNGFEFTINGQTYKISTALKEETKTSLIFDNGGQIYSLPNSASTIRGFHADLIVLDEAAHFLNGTD